MTNTSKKKAKKPVTRRKVKPQSLGAVPVVPVKQYATGFIPQAPDPRDVPYAQIFGAAKPIDWSNPLRTLDILNLVVEDQGPSLSCVAQAWSKLAEVWYKLKSGKPYDASAHAVYSKGYLSNGGMYGSAGGSILIQDGVFGESLVPSYENTRPPSEAFMRSKPSVGIVRDFGIPGYLVVQPNIDEMARALETHAAVVFGVIMSNEGWQTGEVRPPLPGESTAGHFILASDRMMRNGKRTLEFQNSWSKRWGYNGRGYLDENYFTAGTVFAGYVIDDIPDAWKTVINMHDVIKVQGSDEQYVVAGPSPEPVLLRIPDIETRDFLVSGMFILPSARTVTAQELVSYPTPTDFPSVKVYETAKGFYGQLRDAFELAK